MKQLLAILSLFLILSVGIQSNLFAQDKAEMFTIYLVRHAEKDSGSNPPLTKCGEERAEHLNTFLNDVQLKAVYSTDYTRTMATAAPTAKNKNLKIQEYDGNDLDAMAALLVNQKQDVLVVGHSNTTGVLAGLLVGEELPDIDLDTYNRIYQVVVHEKAARLHLFHTSFSCNH